MTCRTCHKHLSAWLDGELSAALAAKVKTHTESCPACAVRAEKLRNLLGLVDGLPPLPLSRDFDAQFARKLLRAKQQRIAAMAQPRRQWWKIPAMATAAAAVSTVVIAMVLFHRLPAGNRPNEMDMARNIELLRDYQVVSNLDALEDFEVVASLDSLMEEK